MQNHKKRYMIITSTWNFKPTGNMHLKHWIHLKKGEMSLDDYDTINEVNEHINFIKELYKNVEKPIGVEDRKYGLVNIPDGSFFGDILF